MKLYDNESEFSSKYTRKLKIISVLWAFFTLCYVLISVTAFFADWIIGEDGNIGLWSACNNAESYKNDTVVMFCLGNYRNFISFPGKTFQIATIFVGLAAFAAALSVCAMLFFLCCHSCTVFSTCGWLQLISVLLMSSGLITFSTSWKEDVVQKICGQLSKENCQIHWGFILAILASLDGFILCTLAFVLASRYAITTENDNISNDTLSNFHRRHFINSSTFSDDKTDISRFRDHHLFYNKPRRIDDSFSRMSSRSVRSHLPYSAHNFDV